MKKLPEDSIFRKKSFFVALYSCVGAVLILVVVVSYININHAEHIEEPSYDISEQLDETAADLTEPNPEIAFTADEMIARSQAEAARRAVETQREAAESIARRPTAVPTPSPEADEPTPAPEVVPESTSQSDRATSDSAFGAFQDGDYMDWPVVGEIVLDYSTDRLIKDVTLDQYRTNDSLWISAKAGSPVRASFEGVVQSIDETRRYGTIVVIDNGNGWTTTYGQLLDSVIVEEGEVVTRGQVIGGVANPTVFGSVQGPHVSFRVERDDETVDPRSVLRELTAEAIEAVE